MNDIQFESSGRSMRWYEWLAGLLLLSLALGVRADAVYKCVSSSGSIAFQDKPCATSAVQSEVEIAPAPAYVPPPPERIEQPHRAVARATYRAPRPPVRKSAFACRASDGRVFYRLGRCPSSLADSGGGRSSKRVSVSSEPVDREEACYQMRRAGAIGRSGHEYDEHISTYDKNLGRDPCA